MNHLIELRPGHLLDLREAPLVDVFGASGLLAGRVGAMGQIGLGLALMGTSLVVLMMPRRMPSVLALVGLLALGMALISPNL